MKVAVQFICLLSSIMLILSCLLICFNPRDEIEVELLKTGVMTEEDVEAIRRLKEDRYMHNTKSGSKINFQRLDDLKREQKQRDRNSFGIASRKRMSRVSPTNGNEK